MENPLSAGTPRHPTLEECRTAGQGPTYIPGKGHTKVGLPNTPEERKRFEAYMCGHCWAFGSYDEELKAYDTVDVRMLYGVWRDRGALPTMWPMHNDGANEDEARIGTAGEPRLTAKAPVDEMSRLRAEVELLHECLCKISTAAAFLPSFGIHHEGGIEAATQNIVDALEALTSEN